jgi:dipeptidyl aminopeptidase/acylaminoacyl peptidase
MSFRPGLPSSVSLRRLAMPLLAIAAFALPAAAQQGRGKVFTADDYRNAETDMFASTEITDAAGAGRVTPTWIAGDRFWYQDGSGQFVLVDPARKSKAPAFDHARVATALSAATGGRYDAQNLPFDYITFTKDMKSVMVTVNDKEWSCAVNGSKCTALPAGTIPERPAGGFGFGRGGRGRGGRGGFGRGGGAASRDGHPLSMAPNGRIGVFIRDWNLWVEDTTTHQERQLTTDGVENFGYATDNAGWTKSDRAVVAWSPDSKYIATQQQDQRGDGDMYLVTTPNGDPGMGPIGNHPVLQSWKYPLPGDSVVTMIHRLVIDVDNGAMVRFQMPPDQHRSIQGDNLSMNDVKWNPDDSSVVFASVSRFHKHVWIKEANTSTGAVRTLFEESEPTHVESWTGWQVLWPSHEILWYSQRDNWGQIYLYDLNTGQLKNQVTTGVGDVSAIDSVDLATRTLWFTAEGKDSTQMPYYHHYYRVNLDGTHQVSLTPGEGEHTVSYSPDRKYLVDVWDESDVPPASAVRSATTGALIMPLEQAADTAKLRSMGWHPVTTFHEKARDGVTDVYGLMYKPANFDPSRKYPIINNIYPGPQTGSVGSWSFRTAGGEQQGLADLGFIVVQINGMGTPHRSKKFMDAYYGDMGDNTLPDQVAAEKELAQQYPWIDLSRTGIYGHSGGGFATADAMFRYPDFFKVGISESGNHDNREYEDDWGERYEGPVQSVGNGKTNYDLAANEEIAKNLKGHLLLAHGTIDDNVPPYNTLLVVDALIKANKDFDLLLLPNQHHGYGQASSYMQRRRWDYFVTWLLDGTPPSDYVMGQARRGGAAGRGGRGGRGGGRGGN